MGNMVEGMFGGGKSETRALKKQQEEQKAQLEAERARLDRAEEGRSKLRSSRRGLLAFLDKDPDTTTTLGGEAETEEQKRRRRGEGGSSFYDSSIANA